MESARPEKKPHVLALGLFNGHGAPDFHGDAFRTARRHMNH